VAEESLMNHTQPGVLARVRTTLSLLAVTVVAGTALTIVTAAPTVASTSPDRHSGASAQRIDHWQHWKKRDDRREARQRARHRHHIAARGNRIVGIARSQAGKPYSYGASGPGAYDCSGLTMWVYRHIGVHLPHNSAAQAGRAHHISRAAARRGDLVFFHDGGGVYHVAIYAGGNTVWHAPYSGTRVRKERIWTRSVSFGRVG
jgi:cell wall-associated NlpC family hydrolase